MNPSVTISAVPRKGRVPRTFLPAEAIEVRDGKNIAELCRAVRRGNEAAFEELYRAWFDRVYAMARRAGARDEAACLDVCQEVFLSVVRKLPVLESGAALHGWLTRVTERKALDAARAARRRIARERTQRTASQRAASVSDRSLSANEGAERTAWAARELANLSDKESRLLRARFVEEKPLSEMEGGRDAAHGVIRRTLARLRRAAKEVFDVE